jgi:hypothetical protein
MLTLLLLCTALALVFKATASPIPGAPGEGR